LKSGLT